MAEDQNNISIQNNNSGISLRINTRWFILSIVHFAMEFLEHCFGNSILCISIVVLVLNGKLCSNHNNFKLQKLLAITS